MSYAILRVEKCKSLAAVGSRAAHNLRAGERAAPHADPGKRKRNVIEAGADTVAGIVAATEARLASAGKFRKDAVRAVEVLLTASPEFFTSRKPADLNAWHKASMDWLRQTWGTDNIVSCVLHLDERTPHLQALVVPIHQGKLRAAHWLDGPSKLATLQDSYAKAVEGVQLRRGRRSSPAEHVPLRSFYDLAKRIATAVQKAVVGHKPPKLPPRGALGRVSSDDWEQLESDLARYGAEGLKLRAEAVAGRLIASSEVGQEAGRRAEAARKEKEKAEAELARVRRDLAEAQAQRQEVEARVRGQRALMRDLQEQAAPLQAVVDKHRAEISRLQALRRETEQAIERQRPGGAAPVQRPRDRG